MSTRRLPKKVAKTLAKFDCPFNPLCKRTGLVCPLDPTCPFGSHSRLKPRTTRSRSEQTDTASLLLFPANYVCYQYLIGECTEDAGETPNHGLHLDNFEELTDLPELKRKYYSTKVERHHAEPRKKLKRAVNRDPPEKEPEPEVEVPSCPICIEEIIPGNSASPILFAIQENCSHIFCSDCLIKWRQTNHSTEREFSCPLCRTISELVVTVEKLPASNPAKAYLFACQKKITQLARPVPAVALTPVQVGQRSARIQELLNQQANYAAYLRANNR